MRLVLACLLWRQVCNLPCDQRQVENLPPQKTGLMGFLQQLLPTGETGVDLVPVPYLGLALAPAQTDLSAILPAREVDQTHKEVLQLDAERAQLLDVSGHPLAAPLELLLRLIQLLALEIVQIFRRA